MSLNHVVIVESESGTAMQVYQFSEKWADSMMRLLTVDILYHVVNIRRGHSHSKIT